MTEPRPLPLDGMTVTRIAIDDSLTLICRAADGRDAEIRIDGAFSVAGPAGDTETGCIEDSPQSAAPVLSQVYCVIRTARVTDTGALEIGFADNTLLTADAEDHFVSWELKASDGFHAVCLADRDVVVKEIA
jgi:hypothetical protein